MLRPLPPANDHGPWRTQRWVDELKNLIVWERARTKQRLAKELMETGRLRAQSR